MALELPAAVPAGKPPETHLQSEGAAELDSVPVDQPRVPAAALSRAVTMRSPPGQRLGSVGSSVACQDDCCKRHLRKHLLSILAHTIVWHSIKYGLSPAQYLCSGVHELVLDGCNYQGQMTDQSQSAGVCPLACWHTATHVSRASGETLDDIWT